MIAPSGVRDHVNPFWSNNMKLVILAAAVAILGLSDSAFAQRSNNSNSYSNQANQHHRNQMQRTEQRRQQDNRSVQQYNNRRR